MRDVQAIILGGGRGTRLYPLTMYRAKPAVPLAGKYRLIDIPLSNCINSEIYKIFVLTQFNSASLNRHINRTYQFSHFSEAFVEVLAAQQTYENTHWYQGTADAVRQHIPRFQSRNASTYLILSGDHLYRMDYQKFVQRHRDTDADITIAALPMDEQRASGFGLMKIDQTGQVRMFREKPRGDELREMQVNTRVLGLAAEQAKSHPYIASMGIYVFKQDVLCDLLKRYPEYSDFGKEIIPEALDKYKIQTFLFDDYWEDIGTMRSFFQANMDLLTQPSPRFSFYHASTPIFTRPRFLPPSIIAGSHIEASMIADGCVIKKAHIRQGIVGIRSQIGSNSVIERSVIAGADFYQTPAERDADIAAGKPHVGIGENVEIRNAIIDKNARIGNHVKIINKEGVQESSCENEGFCIRNGIVIIVKNSIIPDGTVI